MFTVAYRLEGSPSLEYGQVEIFFKAPVGSRTSCGTVLKPLSRPSQGICKQSEVLGRPVSHIIALHHPHRHLFVIVLLENIIDVCVYIAFSDSQVHCAPHFPNHLERD